MFGKYILGGVLFVVWVVVWQVILHYIFPLSSLVELTLPFLTLGVAVYIKKKHPFVAMGFLSAFTAAFLLVALVTVEIIVHPPSEE